MIDILLDTLIDGFKILPFLFFAFLLIEIVEHKLNNHTKDTIVKSGKFGPILGGILGGIPQCGFSVMATNLYVTRIISLGTLISIYLSTSDEMLPILLSRGVNIWLILKLVGIKMLIGILWGVVIDIFFKRNIDDSNSYEIYNICESEHCHCEDSIIKSSIKHTFNIFIFIFIISFILSFGMEYIGYDNIKNIFNKSSVLGPIIASLIGLIPNCGASVIITELYLNGVINMATCIAGLLTGSGVSLLVLFKTNKNMKDNIRIVVLLYLIGVVSGILFSWMGLL